MRHRVLAAALVAAAAVPTLVLLPAGGASAAVGLAAAQATPSQVSASSLGVSVSQTSTLPWRVEQHADGATTTIIGPGTAAVPLTPGTVKVALSPGLALPGSTSAATPSAPTARMSTSVSSATAVSSTWTCRLPAPETPVKVGAYSGSYMTYSMPSFIEAICSGRPGTMALSYKYQWDDGWLWGWEDYTGWAHLPYTSSQTQSKNITAACYPVGSGGHGYQVVVSLQLTTSSGGWDGNSAETSKQDCGTHG